jgi:hypothetical protein
VTLRRYRLVATPVTYNVYAKVVDLPCLRSEIAESVEVVVPEPPSAEMQRALDLVAAIRAVCAQDL